MKVKIEDQKNSQQLLHIEVEQDIVNKILAEVYKDIGKTAVIPGFRIGKAPRDMLEKHYSETVESEAVKRIISEAYGKAVDENKIDAIGYPAVESIDFKKDKPFTFTAKVDVAPKLKLKAYKGIKIQEKSSRVTQEESDQALKNIQESMVQYENVENRPLKNEDYVVTSYECLVDGKIVDKNENLWLYISEKLKPKELYSALVGAEVNISKEVEVQHPKDYPYENLAGRKTIYKITPKQIKKKILPEINDKLAKETGKFNTLDELKTHINEKLVASKNRQARMDTEKQIFESLLKNNVFDVPQSLVKKQIDRLVENRNLMLLYQGYKKEDIDKEEPKLRESLKQKAVDDVRIFFILREIARANNLTVTDADIKAKIEEIARSNKQSFEFVEQKIKENGNLDNFQDQLLQDKIIDFLIAEAKISKE